MIPIGDNIPNRSRPIVNYWLIGFNIALFFWEIKLEATGELSNFIRTWGMVPARISNVVVDAFTSGNPAAVVAGVVFASSLLSAIFLHGSFSQILGNLIFLWVFGGRVEEVLGHRRYLAFYLLCGILTGIVQILVNPTLSVPLIGANGASASVLGAYLLHFPKAKIDTILPLGIVFIPIELPALFYPFWWFVQPLFYGIGSLNIAGGVNLMGIAYWANGFGLFIGAALVRLLVRDSR